MIIKVESETLKTLAKQIIDCCLEPDKMVCFAGRITYLCAVKESEEREQQAEQREGK